MQSTGDANHDAAILAPSRLIGEVVSIDWPHGGADGDFGSPIADVTFAVASWDLDRSITTSLPEEVRLAEGVAAAELTITLGGQDTPALVGTDGVYRPIIDLFSPYNTASELYGDNLMGRLVQTSVACQGFGTVRQFTGRVRKIEPQPAAGTVKITALDHSESLRVPADLPVFVAYAASTSAHDVRMPGLNGSWVVNYLARKAGFYTSPKRNSAILEASMNGSAWPEYAAYDDGVFSMSTNPDGSADASGQLSFTTGAHGQAVVLSDGLGTTSRASYKIPPQPMASASIHIEGWFSSTGSVNGWNINLTGNAAGAAASIPSASFPFVFIYSYDNVVALNYYRAWNYGTGALASGTIAGWPNDGQPHYFAVRLTFSSSTTVTAQACVDGTTYGSVVVGPVSGGAPTVTTSFWELQVVADSRSTATASDLCVTTESGTITWNNGFTPTAIIDTSALELTTIPPTKGSDAWTIVQDIAAAESATAGFDEFGVFNYRARSHYESTAGYTSVRTIDSDTALIDLATTSAIDTVRNDIRVPVQPYSITPFKSVWESGEAIRLAPGAPVTVVADLTDTVFDCAVPVYGNNPWDIVAAGPATSGYYANTKADGSGRQLGQAVFTLDVTGDGLTITIRNKHRDAIYLVYPKGMVNGDGSDIGGQPSLWIGGRAATAGDVTKVQLRDESAALQQVYEAPTSVWRQTSSVAETLAVDLLSDLGTVKPQFTDVPIVGDYRLQLGDTVLLSDPDRLKTSQEARIIGIRTSFTPASFAQTLDVRALYSPSVIILDRVGSSELDGATGRVLG